MFSLLKRNLLAYLSGGNIKVAAVSIADLHFYCKGSYLDAFTIRMESLIGQSLAKKNAKTEILQVMVQKNLFQNYVDLAVLDLSIGAAPDYVLYYETHDDFSGDIARYLKQKNIPNQYITEDNTQATKAIMNELYIQNFTQKHDTVSSWT